MGRIVFPGHGVRGKATEEGKRALEFWESRGGSSGEIAKLPPFLEVLYQEQRFVLTQTFRSLLLLSKFPRDPLKHGQG